MLTLLPVQNLLAELKRRKVFRVAAGYAAAAFVIIEGADLVFPRIGLSEQSVTAVVWAALLLLPVAIAAAWVYDVDEGRLRATEPAAPGELESITEEPRSRRWPIGILAAGATVLLFVTAWLTLGGSESDPTAIAKLDPNVIVVLPFAVHGPEDQAYLGRGLVDLLTPRLDGVGSLRTVPARSVLGKVRQEAEDDLDPAAAEKVAASLGAGRYVQGEVLEVGGRLSITAALRKIGDEGQIEATIEGSDSELLEMVDELTAELVAGLEGSGSGRVRQLAALTTASLAALKAYLHGDELLRAGQFTPALAAFEEAVALDSTFALAHYRLSVAREWGSVTGATAAADAAHRHASRLSDRDRLLVDAMWTWRHGNGREAEDLYRTVLGRWPDDMEAWLQLAEVLNHFMPMMGYEATRSTTAFERVLDYEPEHLLSLWHLVRLEARAGNLERADSLVNVIRRLSPEGDRTLELLAMVSARGGSENWPAVAGALREAQDITPYFATWNVAVYAENVEKALELAGLLVEPGRSSEVRATGFLQAAVLQYASGRTEEAERALKEVEALDPELAKSHRALFALHPQSGATLADLERHAAWLAAWAPPSGCVSNHPVRSFEPGSCIRPVIRSYLLGVTLARLGRSEEAMAEIAQIERLQRLDGDQGHAPLFIPAIRAEIEIQRGDTLGALALLEAAPAKAFYIEALQSAFYTHGLTRYRRAELLDSAGRAEDATRWYGSFDDGSIYDILYRGTAEVRLGELHESAGRTEEAASYFAKSYELLGDGTGSFADLAARAQAGLERTTAH
jgi:tetratricopeptide (TPR) repeat protein